ncbi:MAG: hypothetical protein K2L37_02870, partial [Lactobacillus sp.]|nr:hypothetical protein [Lactobacillus sp.]
IYTLFHISNERAKLALFFQISKNRAELFIFRLRLFHCSLAFIAVAPSLYRHCVVAASPFQQHSDGKELYDYTSI